MTLRQGQKYILYGANRELLLCRLRAALQPDPYAVHDGRYQIRTLYFDDVFDSALFDTFSGAGTGKILAADVQLRPEFFTAGEKDQAVRRKKSRTRSSPRRNARLLLRGKYQFLKEKTAPFLQGAYAAARAGKLNPRYVVNYTRAAFVTKLATYGSRWTATSA